MYLIQMSNSYIWPMERTLSGATIPDQRGPKSDGYEGVLHIPQNSSFTGTSPSDCLMSYQDTRWSEGLNPQQRYSRYILQSQTIWLLNYVY